MINTKGCDEKLVKVKRTCRGDLDIIQNKKSLGLENTFNIRASELSQFVLLKQEKDMKSYTHCGGVFEGMGRKLRSGKLPSEWKGLTESERALLLCIDYRPTTTPPSTETHQTIKRLSAP